MPLDCRKICPSQMIDRSFQVMVVLDDKKNPLSYKIGYLENYLSYNAVQPLKMIGIKSSFDWCMRNNIDKSA